MSESDLDRLVNLFKDIMPLHFKILQQYKGTEEWHKGISVIKGKERQILFMYLALTCTRCNKNAVSWALI